MGKWFRMTEVFDILLIELGVILFFGIFGALVLKRYGIPSVLGLLVMGILIGVAFDVLPNFGKDEVLEYLSPIVALALGFIGFNIGHELDFETIKKLDPKILIILFFESVGALVLVSILTYIVTESVPIALVFGALASATAPAATADVVWEYKAKGELSTTLMAILVLDDILAIVLIDIALEFSLSIYKSGSFDVLDLIIKGLYHSVASCVIGFLAGGIVAIIIPRVEDPIETLELVFGTLIALIGIASILDLSLILACMVYGTVAESLTKVDTRELIHQVFRLGAPVIAIFFIMVGIEADPAGFIGVGLIGALYILGRSVGKIGGAYAGSNIAQSPEHVKKYLGICLLSQAGVPVALAVLVAEKFSKLGGEAADAGVLILGTVTATTLVVQLFAPLLVKWALNQAGELEAFYEPVLSPKKGEPPKIIKEILEGDDPIMVSRKNDLLK